MWKLCKIFSKLQTILPLKIFFISIVCKKVIIFSTWTMIRQTAILVQGGFPIISNMSLSTAVLQKPRLQVHQCGEDVPPRHCSFRTRQASNIYVGGLKTMFNTDRKGLKIDQKEAKNNQSHNRGVVFSAHSCRRIHSSNPFTELQGVFLIAPPPKYS